MRDPPLILVADDSPESLQILQMRLSASGYETLTANNGEDALSKVEKWHPDLILLDVMMPRLDGVEVCRRIRADSALPFIPIIMVTAKSDSRDVVSGLDAGANEYLTKPVEQTALIARVRSMLRIKALHDTTQEQATRLEAQAEELEQWNRGLEARVAEQREELERLSQLKRYFSPQLSELIVTSGNESLIDSHRREITVVFCDLRSFTQFAETAEPEEVMGVLREYHDAIGPLTFRYEATLEHIIGDGLTAFFNDPLPCDDPAARAVRMAVAMRREVEKLNEQWRKHGHDLGFGVGLAMGYATLGHIGFEGQFHYGAIGSVLNLAARLCDKAESGQILMTRRVYAEVEDLVEAEPLGSYELKGFHRPVPAFNVLKLKHDEPDGAEASEPELRSGDGG